MPLKSQKDRKQEVKRLETALERLLINLGSDQDPQRIQYQIPEEEEIDQDLDESEQPTKRSAEGDKLTNTMTSNLPQEPDEDLEREQMMDSYINTARHGSMGKSSGVVSPMVMEMQ